MNVGQSTLSGLHDGDWWVDESGFAHSGDSVDKTFDTLFLRHLGHIKLSISESRIAVTWDVGTVSEDSVAHVADWLRSEPGVPARLKFFYYGWAEETVAGGEPASQRMSDIQALRSVRQIPSTHVQDRGAVAVHSAPTSIRRGFELWYRTGGKLGNATHDECSELLPRVIFYRPDQQTGELVFSWVGSRSLSTRVHGRAWSRRALQSRSSNTVGSESANYVNRISSAYDDVWSSGEPHYACIQTLLSPDDDQEPVWLNYHRLLLRLHLHDGRPALMCLSEQADTLSKLPLTAP